MKLVHRVVVVAVAIAVLLLAPSARGDEEVRFEFEGGTVEEYVDALRAAIPRANVIVAPNAASAVVPSMSVTALPHEWFALVRVLARVAVVEDGARLLVGTESTESSLAIVQLEERVQRPQPPTQVRAFSLAGLLTTGSVSAEDALQSVEVTIDLLHDDGVRVEIRFHEPTKLLIARGTEAQLAAISSTIDELGVTAAGPVRDLYAPRAEASAERLMFRVLELEATIKRLNEEIRTLKGEDPE